MLNLNYRVFQLIVALGTVATVAAAESAPVTFSVPAAWNVPAATLQPGTYSIRILDRLPDRAIISINSKDGLVHTTFIGIPSRNVAAAGHSGPVMWPGNGEAYLRGWKFPGDSTVMEFAYPKAVAVSLARREQAPVTAVDPDSEGMKAVPNALASKADMEVISLWLLSANQVGPDRDKAEIKAARYQPGPDAPAPKHVAAVTSNRLPKTASEIPSVMILAFLSFGVALSIRYTRKARS